MVNRVYSKEFKRNFIVGDNQSVVKAFCPTDGTKLVAVSEMDFRSYYCNGCGKHYNYGDRDKKSLKKQANEYVSRLISKKEELTKELGNLEKIIRAAKKNKIIK